MEIEEPSAEAIARFCQIPIIQQNVKMLSKYSGVIAADSWQGATPIDVRDVTTGFVRHLKLTAGKTSLELVAERKENSWSFVARVYEGNKISSEYLLWVGAKRLLSRSQGFYMWSSKRPPGRIRLISQSKEIEFERLQWA